MNFKPALGPNDPRFRWRAAWVLAPIVIGAVAIGLIGQSAGAQGSVTVWTHAASACSPDEASFGRFDAHVSSFKHAPAATGQIVTRCNIVDLPQFGIGEIQVLDVVYRDQDGPGTAQRVRAELIRSNNAGVTSVIRTFDSNAFAGSSATQRRFVSYSHTFNFEANAYFVQVRVDRATTNITPLIATVRLTKIVG
jgi:hypothetical protein